MKILLISMLFQPDTSIGSIRPTQFAKWLSNFGHHVIVLTNNEAAELSNDDNLDIIYVSSDCMFKRTNKNISQYRQQNHKSTKMHVPPIMRYLRTSFKEWRKCNRWVKNCIRLINSDMRFLNFDVIFSSAFPVGSLWLGYKCKVRMRNSIWVCDLRDLPYDEEWPGWLNLIYRIVLRPMMNKADVITFISDEGAEKIRVHWLKKKTNVKSVITIPNGFEPIELRLSETKRIDEQNLSFCYTGSLYSGKRDLGLLMQAISELIKGGKISLHDVTFHYAGSDYDILLEQAKEWEVENIIIDAGLLNRNKTLQLQMKCDILIVASWNTLNEQGVMTGKYFEYLRLKKPIIGIISGEVPNAALSELIDKMRIGLSCEAARRDTDLIKLKSYIYGSVCELREKGHITIDPNRELIDSYRYDNITRRLEDLIYELQHEINEHQ